MRSLLLAAACAAFAVPGVASARDDDTNGFYVSIAAGVAKVNDVDIRYYDLGGTFGGTGTTDSAETTTEFSSAAAFTGTLGYDFGPVRADMEISYSRSKMKAVSINSINGSPVTLTSADVDDVCLYLEFSGCSASGNRISFDDGGRIRQLSGMANVWADLPVTRGLTLSAGGGIGANGFESDGEGKVKFAWQLGASVALDLSRAVALTADFRHREVSGADIPWDDLSGFEVGRVRTNSLSAGLRFRF